MRGGSIIRDGYKGKVRYYEETVGNAKGKTRFRHKAVRKDVPKEDHWGEYDSWLEAEAGAAQVEAERLSRGRALVDPAVIRAVQRGILNTKADALDAEGLLEDGFFLREFMNEVNEFLKIKEEAPLPSTRIFLCEMKQKLKSETEEKTKKEEIILYSKIIDEFIEWKTGPHGGRGNKELGDGAKTEWKTIAGYIKVAIGGYSSATGKKDIRSAITDAINKGTINRSGAGKGKPWSPAYRYRISERAQTICEWAFKQEHLTANPMAGLANEFAHENDEEVSVFSPEKVQKIFAAATELHDGIMIPYFAMLFYSTVRPEELADFQRAGERFFWKNMNGWRHNLRYLGRIGGLEFKVPKFEMINGVKTRRSKISTRQAFVTPTGMAWLRYYFGELQEQELPNEGQIFASRKYRSEIKEAAGIIGGWPQDQARHSICSYGYYHDEFRKILKDDDWHRASGHKPATFKKHYDAPQHQPDCTAYFAILPPGTTSLAAAVEEEEVDRRAKEALKEAAASA
jgi:hypothetical protein